MSRRLAKLLRTRLRRRQLLLQGAQRARVGNAVRSAGQASTTLTQSRLRSRCLRLRSRCLRLRSRYSGLERLHLARYLQGGSSLRLNLSLQRRTRRLRRRQPLSQTIPCRTGIRHVRFERGDARLRRIQLLRTLAATSRLTAFRRCRRRHRAIKLLLHLCVLRLPVSRRLAKLLRTRLRHFCSCFRQPGSAALFTTCTLASRCFALATGGTLVIILRRRTCSAQLVL